MQPPLVFIEDDKCKVCYTCIRICPVKAIELRLSSDIPYIHPERCIGCGSCIEVCHPKAIAVLDSKKEVAGLISSDYKVAAVLDPAISAEFKDISDYRKLVKMVSEMGFDYVHDGSFGVDLVAKEYNSLVSNFLGKYYMMANCPPVVSFIEKYHPHLIENLAPIVNPMIASAKVIRQLYGNEIKVVFIGPCVGAKEEALRFDGDARVDAVLTFAELRQMFEELNIHESTIEYSDFNEPRGYKGSLYPISDGILQASGIGQDMLTGSVLTTDGKARVLESTRQFEESIGDISRHFNIFFCEGCLMGPGMSPGGQKLSRKAQVVSYTQKRLKDFNMAKWNKELQQYDDLSLKRDFEPNNQRLPVPPEDKVEDVLRLIDKLPPDNLDCLACGYNTCREFAEAVANEITRPDMCTIQSLKNKQEYIRTLKQTNDKLAKTQLALQNSEKRALAEKQIAQEALDTNQIMLHKLPTAVVIVDDDLKVIGSNESFVTILGEDAAEINEIIPGLIGADLKTLLPVQFYKLFAYTLSSNEDVVGRDVHLNDMLLNVNIFSIKKNKIVGGVIRDMNLPEVRREEVINRVTEVIDQNLDLVQQIAFLLGEGAAKTEKMLNSIIESHKKDS